MTKAAQIMALHAKGLTTREIALKVYGDASTSHKAYVRVVTNQRKGSSESKFDIDWRKSERGKKLLNDRVMRHYWANRDAINEKRRAARKGLPKELRIS